MKLELKKRKEKRDNQIRNVRVANRRAKESGIRPIKRIRVKRVKNKNESQVSIKGMHGRYKLK